MASTAAALAVLLATSASAGDAPLSVQEEAPRWSFSGEGLYYYLPDDGDYSLWTLSAKRGLLHLEARYNYEDLRTFSAFVGLNFGLNFGLGDKLRLELTPMVGAVVGRTNGLGPGLELDLSYWKLELSSELEYVIDLKAPGDSFFYGWTELSLWPVEWARAGIVFERAKAVETGFDLQRGFLLGLSYKYLSATVHFLNPGSENAYTIFALSAEF